MNYYKRHIGDYAAKAGHLSALEHGVYTLLIDAYYNREEGPTRAEAIRIARARTPEELAAVEIVLGEFFTEADGRFLQSRVEDELAAFRLKQEVNRELGARGGKANAKRIATETLSDSEANDKPSHKPLAISHKEKQEEPNGSLSAKTDVPNCPHDEIISLYHEILPANPRIKVWSGDRAKALRTRWREDGKRQSLDYWQRFFGYVGKSEFLTGRVHGREGRPFTPGLDWLVNASNFAKIIEGRYHGESAE